jgi:hypothetical protein
MILLTVEGRVDIKSNRAYGHDLEKKPLPDIRKVLSGGAVFSVFSPLLADPDENLKRNLTGP